MANSSTISLPKIIRYNKSQIRFNTKFGDPLSDTFDDPDHSADEQRFLIIGNSENGKLLFVSHTDDGDTIRIISAREPTRGEREKYERGEY